MDVKPWTGIEPKSCSNGIGKLPSMALDTGNCSCVALPPASMQSTGIPAGMTVLAEASR